ncbi:MAG: hypothetical protein ACQERC_11005 [Bacteroidota bacterium]
MFYFFTKPAYRLGLVLLVIAGGFLYFADAAAEMIITWLAGREFNYAEPAQLKLIYLVLLAVTIGLMVAVENNDAPSDEDKGSALARFILFAMFAYIVGFLIHLWSVVHVITSNDSMMALEANYWLYYIADYCLIVGFAYAGLRYLKPVIHQN